MLWPTLVGILMVGAGCGRLLYEQADCQYFPWRSHCPSAGTDTGSLDTGSGDPALADPTSSLAATLCGNGTLDAGEGCDDGNRRSGDGCNSSCLPSLDVLQVQAGTWHNCVRFSNNEIKCWGGNDDGQLGYANLTRIGDNESPSTVGFVSTGGAAKQLAAGANVSCVLFQGARQGEVTCWGHNAFGSLGRGNTLRIGDNELPSSLPSITVAGASPAAAQVQSIAAGISHVCVVLAAGEVKCWGLNDDGQLGLGNTNNIGDGELPASTVPLPLGTPALQLAAGNNHNCALLTNGRIKCWGSNGAGQLGQGNTTSMGDNEGLGGLLPVEVGGLATQVVAGDDHTCALLTDGSVRCWGNNFYGQLGQGNTINVGGTQLPSSVPPVPLGGAAVQIAAGRAFTCALLTDGTIRCWGDNDNGQLGRGNTARLGDDEPVLNGQPVFANMRAVQISAGWRHSCALMEDGSVRCWGGNNSGQLGLGNTSNLGNDELPSSVNPVLLLEP